MGNADNQFMANLSNLLLNLKLPNGDIACAEVSDYLNGTCEIALTVHYLVEGVTLKKIFQIRQNGHGEPVTVYFKGQTVSLGTHDEASIAREFAGLLEGYTPVIIRKKEAKYNGWQMFLVTCDKRHGAMAHNGRRWISTDMTFIERPFEEELRQLKGLIKTVGL